MAKFVALISVGNPKADVNWFKDGKPLKADNTKYRIAFDNDTATLEILNSEVGDAAEYGIEALNKVGKVTSQATLIVNGMYVWVN